jgi:ergothioneine biosynthesis protein EgtB
MTSISPPSHRDAHRGPNAATPSLADRFGAVRRWTEALAGPLEVEDCVVSSMPDVSPTKWHLAHTTWFFETFVLADHAPAHQPVDPRYAFLFNSYYVQAGERHCRAQRGLATRPTLAEVLHYRHHVTEAVLDLLERVGNDPGHPVHALVELGIHHEQQHQELLLTDIKHVLWTNPLRPTYRARPDEPTRDIAPLEWIDVPEGIHRIGFAGDGFAYDNESPRHRVFLEPSRLANRLVTNGEYLAFIDDNGYSRPELWLSAGLATVQDEQWVAPLYWERTDGGWTEFTLAGDGPLKLDDPVCHLSYYEADAYARWLGKSLPTEGAWEVAAAGMPIEGHFVESGRHHPAAALAGSGLAQLYGDLWQWTRSSYLGYPGYRPASGAIGEYNGKWMADQWVLRGASCATPASHARHTYRNFFPSATRWQFAGIRLSEES